MGGFQAPLTGHIDAALTQYAAGYRSQQFIADQVMPRVEVARKADKYYIFDRRNAQLIQQTLRAEGSPAQQIRRSLSSTTFACECHALAAAISAEEKASYELGDLQQEAVASIQELLLLDREKAFADMVTDSAVITQGVTLAGDKKWSNALNSDPRADVQTGKTTILKATGVLPNTLLINTDVLHALQNNKQLLEAFKYTRPGIIGQTEIASFFDIPRVLVCPAVYTDKDGTADYVMGKHALLCYVDLNASRNDPSFAKTFVWSTAPDTVGGYAVVVGTYGTPSARADEVSCHWYYDQVVTFPSAAYLLKNAAA